MDRRDFIKTILATITALALPKVQPVKAPLPTLPGSPEPEELHYGPDLIVDWRGVKCGIGNSFIELPPVIYCINNSELFRSDDDGISWIKLPSEEFDL